MAENEVVIEIKARLDSIEKSLKDLEGKSEKTGKKVESDLSKGFNKAAKAAAAYFSARALLGAFDAITSAAARQEDAVSQLNQSLISAGTYSKEASQDLQNYANEIQRTTKLGDELVLEQLALARTFARSNEEAKKMTDAAIDLSAATGMSLDGAIKNLGKTFSGLTGELGESVPALRGLTAEQLKSGAAIDLIKQKYDGFAKAQTNTYSGATAQLKNAFGDLLERIGGLITKSPELVAAIKFIKGQIEKLTGSIQDMSGENGIKGAFEVTLNFSRFLVDTVGRALEVVTRFVYGAAKAFFSLGFAIGELLQGRFSRAVEVMTQDIEVFSTAGSDSAIKFIDGFQQAVDSAPPLKDTLKNSLTGGDGPIQGGELINLESFFNPIDLENLKMTFQQISDGSFKMSKDVSDATKQSVEYFKQMASQINGVVNSLISSGLSSLGGALVKGGSAFGEFAKTAANIMGDFFIQMGMSIIAADQAIIALKASLLSFFGGAGIVAGAALIIAGGALKALAGGPAGAGASGGAMSNLGPDTAAAIAPETTALEEPQPQQPVTQVSVNVQGNILDRRQTGLEIAEAINEAFGTSGVTIARGALV